MSDDLEKKNVVIENPGNINIVISGANSNFLDDHPQVLEKIISESEEEAKKSFSTSKARRKHIPSLLETENFILKTVKGQDEQVRSIVTSVYRSIKFNNMKTIALIIGKSGTGKTEIMRQLAKKLNRVFVTEDANEFTQEGYYGRDVSEMIDDLIKAADGDIEEAEKGILFIDEIDKKAGLPGEGRDVSGLGVLNSLLKLIEGKKMNVPDPEWGNDDREFDTSGVIVIFAGAFEGIEKIAKSMNEPKKIGFSQRSEVVKTEVKYTKRDLIKYGLTEEFVGRIDTIVQMNELTEDVLVDILGNSKKSILKAYEKSFKKYHIHLVYNNSLIRSIAQKAVTSKQTGARELSNVVNYVFEKVIYDVLSQKRGTYHECVLLEGIEDDNSKYILM